MAKRQIKVGSVDQTIDILVRDSSSTIGAGLTGLVYNSGSLVCHYRKGSLGTVTQLNLATQTVGGAHSDGGFVELSAANMPGMYRLDLSDTMVAATGMVTIMLKGATNMEPVAIEIEVITVTSDDLQTSIQGIGTAGGAALNVDANTDNAAGGIGGVTSGTTKVGTETGTFANTSALNGIYHVITGSATALDWVYQFLTGGGTSPVSVVWTGYVNSANDIVTIQVWNHVGATWETIGTIIGNAGTVNIVKNLALFARHRGTAAELGKVYIRFQCSAMTNPILNTDQVYVTYAVTSRTTGYANGAIWIDTVNGTAGTEAFVNGTADHPVSNQADAMTLSTALGIKRFYLAPNSTITLGSSFTGCMVEGSGAIVALGGQDIAGTIFRNCVLSGVATSSGLRPVFNECRLVDVTLPPCTMLEIAMSGTLTLGSAGDYLIVIGSDALASTLTPTINFGSAIGATSFAIRQWHGGIEFANIKTGDLLSIDGVGRVVFASSCTGGERRIRGMFEIEDSSTGMTKTEKANVTLSSMFLTDSGETFVDAVAGSIVKESVPTDDAIRAAVGLTEPDLDNQLEDIHDFIDTEIQNILVILTRVNTLIEDEGGSNYRFTAQALELGGGGGGGDATLANQTLMISMLGVIDDLLDTEVAAIKAQTDLIPANPAGAADITDVSDKLGAFTGSGNNTVLGMLRAMARADGSVPSDLGGSYLASTDSLEAIRNRGDFAWGGGGGGGGLAGAGAIPHEVIIKDVYENPLSNVDVWVSTDPDGLDVIAGTLTTNDAGSVTFLLDANVPYYLWRRLAGYNFSNPIAFALEPI